MSGTGKGSLAAKGQSKAASPAASGQGQQRAQERSVFFQAPAGGARSSEREAAMPEWKLRSLCTEHGLPPTVRGSLHMSGCF